MDAARNQAADRIEVFCLDCRNDIVRACHRVNGRHLRNLLEFIDDVLRLANGRLYQYESACGHVNPPKFNPPKPLKAAYSRRGRTKVSIGSRAVKPPLKVLRHGIQVFLRMVAECRAVAAGRE